MVNLNDVIAEKTGYSECVIPIIENQSLTLKGLSLNNSIMPRYTEENPKHHLYRLKKGVIAKNPYNSEPLPKEVYMDGPFYFDNHFLSLCGFICNFDFYEKQKEYITFDCKEIEKQNHIKFSEIPSYFYFTSQRMGEYIEFGSGVIKHNKYYNRTYNPHNYHRVFDEDVEYAENSSFYETEGAQKNMIHSPVRKLIKIKRFLSFNIFVSEDGYMCNTYSYSFINKKMYLKKMKRRFFLLLS